MLQIKHDQNGPVTALPQQPRKLSEFSNQMLATKKITTYKKVLLTCYCCSLWNSSIQIICIVLERVCRETCSYPHIHTHNLLISRVECINLCFQANAWMYRHMKHTSESLSAFVWRVWTKVSLKGTFSLNLAASEHTHLYTANPQCESTALKLNLSSNVRYRFLKNCLPFCLESCGCTHTQQNYSCHTLLKVCPLLLTISQTKKKYPCTAANKTQRMQTFLGKTLDLFKQFERSRSAPAMKEL